MKNVEDSILNAKDNLPNITPTPPGIKDQSSANDLKARLEWGEPAFTIIDVRDRNTFNEGHILGAMAMPTESLVERAQSSLEKKRDIYIYGDSDDQTAQAANLLREVGFYNVSELKGGLAAWKAISGPTEGIVESRTPPDASEYNIAARIAKSTKE